MTANYYFCNFMEDIQHDQQIMHERNAKAGSGSSLVQAGILNKVFGSKPKNNTVTVGMQHGHPWLMVQYSTVIVNSK